MRLAHFAAALTIFGTTVSAQERAVTSSGRIVVLDPNGTWRYVDGVRTTPGGRARPAEATSRIDLARGRAVLFYEPAKWRQTKSDDVTRATLEHREGDGYALVITERIQVPLEAMREVALSNARGVAPNARIVAEETRRVGGREALMLQMQGTINGIDFVYLGYYLSGAEGTFQVLTYTAANLFAEYRADFERLLDGFAFSPE